MDSHASEKKSTCRESNFSMVESVYTWTKTFLSGNPNGGLCVPLVGCLYETAFMKSSRTKKRELDILVSLVVQAPMGETS